MKTAAKTSTIACVTHLVFGQPESSVKLKLSSSTQIFNVLFPNTVFDEITFLAVAIVVLLVPVSR